jgi:hypothetical protein
VFQGKIIQCSGICLIDRIDGNRKDQNSQKMVRTSHGNKQNKYGSLEKINSKIRK